MIQKELNEENIEIKNKAYELYAKHGFTDGNDFIDWLEAEKQTGRRSRLRKNKQIKNILLAILGMVFVIVVILLIMLFTGNSKVELSEKSLSELKVMMLVPGLTGTEKVSVFGDTHFGLGESTLSKEAQELLDKDVQIMKGNPEINVRMAGYTSATGSEEYNQKLSEKRASTVKNYLIEKGISPERITTIGYGRTKPALYEIAPEDVYSKEAMANMRVLFEIAVKGK